MVTLVSEPLTFKSTVGAGDWTITDTVSETGPPPGPEQLIVYDLLLVKLPVDSEHGEAPQLADFEPDQSPEAAQEVALVGTHVRVAAVL